MMGLRERRLIATIAVLLAANGVLLAPAPRLVAFGAGLLLLGLLPGYLLGQITLSDISTGWLERAVFTIGSGLATTIVGTLALHYVPGPLSAAHILGLFNAVTLILILLQTFSRQRRLAPFENRPSYRYLLPLALVAAAAFFRVSNLGYSEFQGDESRAMLMAAGVIRGEDNILFLHRKGPAEILVPAAFYALEGTMTELVARLPFALASITGVATVYLLSRHLLSDRRGPALLAGALLAVDGYLVAFGRLVQYQSLVFLMTTLSAWCFFVWYREGRLRLTVLGAAFVAVGTLAHYEAVLVVPFLAWLFWVRGRREGWSALQWATNAAGPAVVFGVIFGAFYIPFVRHPHFLTDTAAYITEDRIGGGLLYNNLRSVFDRATFYNSTYYILFLILGGLVWVAYQLRRAIRPTAVAAAIGAFLVFGIAAGLVAPQLLIVRGANLAALPFVLTLVVLTASSGIEDEFKATLLWFGVPFVIALFFTDRPKTHVYTMFPAWVILVGAAATCVGNDVGKWVSRMTPSGAERVSRSIARLRAAAAVAAVALLLVFGAYITIVFVRHEPDFRRDGYPATRPRLYYTFYGDWSPSGGGFAFPHRGGWKGVGALYAQGTLQGSFRSNEETITTSWYTRQAPWCAESPDYYFISHVTHDRWDIRPNRVRRENNLFGKIWSDGTLLLEIYTSQPVDAATDYELEDLESTFDAATTPDVWLWALKSPVPRYRVDAQLDGDVSLMGYDAPQRVSPGDTLSTVLYWEPQAQIDQYYNVFVHLEIEGEAIWAQSDEAPACGAQSTNEWAPGEVMVDGHTLRVDPNTPPGDYPLLVGLYDPMTGARLPVSGRSANEWGNAVRLGTVQVIGPDQSDVTEETGG